ncbi:MAG: cobyrinate a,c-diamide synthase [Planctomycetaceae bacterium]|nr:cobyrinate a,c-diamide synthase [Planctomycetaceae bacterium]
MRSFVIAGTQTGVGKTTIAAGLMVAFARRGRSVQGFKVGPDYIDPSYHRRATGRPSRNLDLWMGGTAAVRRCYAAAAADVNIVEGMMGLFDGPGNGRGSTADVAKAIGVPVILVVDAAGLAQSAGAVVHGFATLDPRLRIAGVIFNRVAGEGHYEYLRRAVRVPSFGWVAQDPSIALPERHLGLVPATERPFDAVKLARSVVRHLDLDLLLERTRVRAPRPASVRKRPARATIACASDEAFSFYYQDNLDRLEAAGAALKTFSPLRGELPEADAVYLGGGFPELHRATRHRRLREAVSAGLPVYAECGGLMYLVGQGLVPGRIEMTDRLQGFGYREVRAERDTVIVRRGRHVRGHEFHHSRWIHPRVPAAWRHDRGAEGYAQKNIHASYVHLHFGGAPECALRFVDSAERWRGKGL